MLPTQSEVHAMSDAEVTRQAAASAAEARFWKNLNKSRQYRRQSEYWRTAPMLPGFEAHASTEAEGE